jgi:Zn finger protein HypA/HybF involved in hydrogenase expression
LNPKKEAGNATTATTNAYATKLNWRENMIKCKRCGKEINEEDSESYDGLCWECWDDQLTEESDTMFDELM